MKSFTIITAAVALALLGACNSDSRTPTSIAPASAGYTAESLPANTGRARVTPPTGGTIGSVSRMPVTKTPYNLRASAVVQSLTVASPSGKTVVSITGHVSEWPPFIPNPPATCGGDQLPFVALIDAPVSVSCVSGDCSFAAVVGNAAGFPHAPSTFTAMVGQSLCLYTTNANADDNVNIGFIGAPPQ